MELKFLFSKKKHKTYLKDVLINAQIVKCTNRILTARTVRGVSKTQSTANSLKALSGTIQIRVLYIL